MREILFRGRRADNGEWVQGYYGNLGEKYPYILTGKLDLIIGYPIFDKYKVDHETVGQYTGLTDKNSRKIFEGDIIKTESNAYVKKIHYITFECGCFCDDCFIPLSDSEFGICSDNCIDEFEVVGNIYDNPELLEVE